ncbi:hypothetical protein ABW20_dc0107510 [Dactylellina cionopaga]|nr:hypothetical protein ABW20_dc0107510 [Dactylellina cionopaga]
MPVHLQQGRTELLQDSGAQAFYGGPTNQPSYNTPSYPVYDAYGGNNELDYPRNREPELARGSVGDVLDLYAYDDSYGPIPYHDTRSNSLRNDIHSSDNHQSSNIEQRRPFDPHQQFSGAQAHRSRSQPNLRADSYPPRPHLEPMPPLPAQQQHTENWNGRTNGPLNSSQGARSNNSTEATLTQESSGRNASLSTSRPPPQRVYPNQRPPDHNKLAQYSQATAPSSVTVGSDDPDALPEHPAPIRPGLVQDAPSTQSGAAQHILPTNQVNPLVSQGKMSIHDIGPVTFDMLNLMRNEIASKPANQPANPSLQFRFAKRLLEASFTLVHDSDSKAARRSPAKLNHPPSAYRTAVCCEIGAGTKKEPQKAVQWYRKAATLGDTAAMYKVGMILHNGLLGQQRNDREAIVWLKRAAEQADEDNPHSLHQLGILYESADGNGSIVRDMAYAKELFTRAAELGYPPSQYRLGTAYAYGLIGCPVDAKLSITWYSRAAASGNAESELALAGWYLTGAEGILEQNDTEAYLWSRKAAEQGLAKAEFAVGHLTELGIGLDGKGSDEEARNWYFRAAGKSDPKWLYLSVFCVFDTYRRKF